MLSHDSPEITELCYMNITTVADLLCYSATCWSNISSAFIFSEDISCGHLQIKQKCKVAFSGLFHYPNI